MCVEDVDLRRRLARQEDVVVVEGDEFAARRRSPRLRTVPGWPPCSRR
jgi:hypothetical protein